jgi:hypothetical protein
MSLSPGEDLENRVSTRIVERGTHRRNLRERVEFLTKPFRDQELLDAIQEAIQRDCANRKHQAEIAEQRARYELLTQREREAMGLVVAFYSISKLPLSWGPPNLPLKIQRRGAKDAGRIVGRVGAAG